MLSTWKKSISFHRALAVLKLEISLPVEYAETAKAGTKDGELHADAVTSK